MISSALRKSAFRIGSNRRLYSSSPIASSWYNPSSWGAKADNAPSTKNTGDLNIDTNITDTTTNNTPPVSTTVNTATTNVEDAAEVVTATIPEVDLNAISADFLATLPTSYWPSDLCTYIIHSTYEYAHCPYWQAIVASTLAIRVATVPVHIRTLRNTSRMQHMNPELKALQKSMEGKDTTDRKVQEAYRAQMQALFKKYDCNPMKSLLLPVIQMPLFMGMFFGLKDLPEKIPELLVSGGPDISPMIGGIGDFANLTVADSTYILPVCTALTFLGMIELGADGMQTEQSKMMRQVFRVLGVASLGFTSWMPQVVFVYWTTNNFFSLTQTIVMKQQPVRDMFGIWKPPKPVPGASTAEGDMAKAWDNLKEKLANHSQNSEEIKSGKTANIDKRVDPGVELHDRPNRPPPPPKKKRGKRR
mmetsp:Transcript_23794/g.49580  ORF Transcript_23794/g.49580 Transcript_23794/m.49580 type:complete len:418 (-) Transcript_23794:17-1270(-)